MLLSFNLYTRVMTYHHITILEYSEFIYLPLSVSFILSYVLMLLISIFVKLEELPLILFCKVCLVVMNSPAFI